MNEHVAVELLQRCRKFLRETRDKLNVSEAVESACLGLDITEALEEPWTPRKISLTPPPLPWGRPP